MKIINASHFSLKKIDTNLTVYTSNNNFIAINSIEDALNSNTWKNNFNPFAYVIVDSQKNKIVLVRDHLGIEPLYYYRDQQQFIFGDTLPDILKHIEKKPHFSENEIEELFLDEKKYTDNTLYENIYRVEPGHLMYFHSNHKEKKVFWQLEREGDTLFYKNDNDYLDHFSELMRESTALATANTHNVAAEFSAGIDSSAVYCAAKECG
ncbi:MAG: hypothetical protein NTU49_01220, partial [Gammaproteobacteria bacterium]|nr:hypothetical protein [Gammaproteobacteria bacterium]